MINDQLNLLKIEINQVHKRVDIYRESIELFMLFFRRHFVFKAN